MNFLSGKQKSPENAFAAEPSIPDYPDSVSLPELPPLPEIPSGKFGDSFGIEAIKSSVLGKDSNIQEKRTFEIPELPSASYLSKQESEERTPKISKPKSPTIKEPVFVKLEKFKLAFEKFEEIKKKAVEIENHITKTQEIREKEEQELKAWEEELKIIKEKINEIDSALFNKVE